MAAQVDIPKTVGALLAGGLVATAYVFHILAIVISPLIGL